MGSWLGLKTTNGIVRPVVALVLAVKRKLPCEQLGSDCVPSRVSWQDLPAQRASISTDVVELRPRPRLKQEHGRIAGPGDYVTGPGDSWGTIGAAIRLPSGAAALITAGHVVSTASSARVWADDESAGDAKVLLSTITDALDVAFLRSPVGVTADNLFQDVARIRDTYSPTASDLSTPLTTLTTRGALHTALLGLDGDFRFTNGTRWTKCIMTAVTTRRGDSGSLLVDDHHRAWGTLRGSVTDNGQTFDCYVPITLLLRRIGADWI